MMKRISFSPRTRVLFWFSRSRSLQQSVVAALIPALALSSSIHANPVGGIVVHGDVSMSGGAGLLTINQGSQNAIINWADFSINAGETTRFVQPGSGAAVLNRVTGGNPSAIHGALEANGNVFVINPNGILVGAGGTIDVHGLVLSTLDVSNGEFLARGDMVFQGGSQAGVVNYGRINAIGGDVFLIGRTVENHGSVSAPSGTVGLGAGSEVLVTAGEGIRGERLFVRAGSGSGGTGVLNDGTIEGAAAELKAHGNVYALAINNKGSVRATGVNQSGGRVFLSAPGGSVRNSGSLLASAPGAGGAASAARVLIEAAYARVDGQIRAEGGGEVRVAAAERVEIGGAIDATSSTGVGGSVVVEGSEIALESGALVDVSGALGGGMARIGGGFQGGDLDIANAGSVFIDDGASLHADALSSDVGGTVIVWSDGDTLFRGDISARGVEAGGFVEVSGREQLGFHGAVTTLAADGSAGVLLLDPTNGTVSAGADDFGGSPFNINAANLVTALGSNHVVISTPSAGTDPGHLSFLAPVVWDSDFSLTALAHGDITFTASVQNAGGGGITAIAGWDGTTGFSGSSPFANGSALAAAFLADSASYGNTNGSVLLGTGTQGAQIAVGSREGTTTILGYDVALTGGAATDRAVQIGYRPSLGGLAGAASGEIRVQALNDVILTAGQTGVGGGSGSGQRNHAQIGHGGRAVDDNAFSHSGHITVLAGLGGSGHTGNVIGNAGRNIENYVMIGHGGTQGGTAAGSMSGDITVIAGNEGRIEFTAGIGRRAFAQIGHGGHAVDAGTGVGFHEGVIVVRAGTDVVFRGGSGGTVLNTDSRAYAQIGHGGYQSRAYSADHGHLGNITVEAGAGGDSGGIVFTAGDLDDNFAQLGHGGYNSRSVTAGADGHSGAITVSALDDIVFLAGTGQAFRGDGTDLRLYAQLGHGGTTAGINNNATPPVGTGLGHSGTISVFTATGDIRFSGGDLALGSAGQGMGRLHYAQLGHGGYNTHGDHHGSIYVEAEGGRIVFSAGDSTRNVIDGSRNYAQLGHGGYVNRGSMGRDGDVIEVSAGGDILFTGSGGTSTAGGRTYAQLGHGGYDADNPSGAAAGGLGHRADILVTSAGGDIRFTSGAGTADYAQLGHGGYATGGDHSGSVTVRAETGDIAFAGRTGANAYVQLGHGGRDAGGNHSGIILAEALGGGISFSGGLGGSEVYAQLGHGGRTARGDHSGRISVLALGDITFTGGSGAQNYAQLGHGGYDADNPNPGNSGYGYANPHDDDNLASAGLPTDEERVGNSGNIAVTSSGGSIVFTSGTANNTYVQIGHGGTITDGDHSGNIVVRAAGDLVFDALVDSSLSTGGNRYAQLGHGGYLASGGHTGNITVSVGGAITFLAGRSNAYAQLGHGGRNDHRLSSATAYVNPRYYAATHVGNIEVSADGDILFSGSTGTGGSTGYAQVGHGGFRNSAAQGEGHSGAISLLSGGAVDFAAGTQSDAYVQIGHGGYESFGNHGNVAVRSETGAALVAASQGGSALLGNGSIARTSVRVTVDPEGTGGGTAVYADDGRGNLLDELGDTVGSVNYATGEIVFDADVNPGGDAVSVAYLHGGSDIVVESLAGVSFSAGPATRAYAQLGHGGFDADFQNRTIRGLNQSGTTSHFHVNTPTGVAVGNSGAVTVRAGVDAAGTVHDAGAGISFSAGTGADTYAFLGHGGLATNGNHRGEIDARAAGSILFTGGDFLSVSGASSAGLAAAAETGGANVLPVANNTRPGALVISIGDPVLPEYATLVDDGQGLLLDGEGVAVGSINYTTGVVTFDLAVAEVGSSVTADFEHFNNARRHVQLGHGGASTASTVGHSGDISVVAGFGGVEGDISFLAGVSTDSYAQLGHGGRSGTGDHVGDIFVDALGDIRFTGNQGVQTYAHLGHGGTSAGLNANTPQFDSREVGNSGDILVNTRSHLVANQGGVYFHAGSGRRSYAQLGHGGYDSDAHNTAADGYDGLGHDAEIRVSAGGDIRFIAPDLAMAPLASDTYRNYVQLGHGGFAANGDHRGDITVQAEGGLVLRGGGFAEGNGGFAIQSLYAQIGHGGTSSPGYGPADSTGVSGGISISVGGDLLVASGAANRAYAQIGHGGYGASQSHSGSISVSSLGGGILFDAGDGTTDSYVQLGHGGRQARGDHGLVDGEGNAAETIAVTAAGDIVFTAGAATRAYAQLGHGGHDANVSADPRGMAANIEVRSLSGSVLFNGGSGNSAYVQLGNGGYTTSGSHRGNILVEAAEDVEVLAFNVSGGAGNAYVQLGHGGRAAIGDHSGSIVVRAGLGGDTGGVFFRAGASQADRYAQLGHGGRNARGTHSGNITVSSLGSVIFQSGTATRNYAQLGHGGQDAALLVEVDEDTTRPSGPGDAGNSGEITVASSGGNIEFRVGGSTTTSPGGDAYVQLGHGGSGTGGNHSGGIAVSASNNLLFRSTSSTGTGQRAYAQLGHGGFNASGNHIGDIVAAAENGTMQFRSGASSGETLVDEVNMAGAYRYAQLGHGGAFAAGTHSGSISALANGTITFSNQGSNPARGGYVQIGHGGLDADSPDGHSGDIGVASRTGNIAFTGGAGASWQAYAQIGHGGFDAAGGHNGHIVVRSGNQVLFDAGLGAGSDSYAQLGHGGAKADGSTDPAADLSGSITVSSQIGGEFSDIGDFGAITFTVGTSTTGMRFRGSTNADSSGQYAQLGHGGSGNLGDHSGAIDVLSSRSVSFLGGAGTQAYAQLGHGGYGAAATTGHSGSIAVRTTGVAADGEGTVTGSVIFTPGLGLESYTQLGHGGLGATGSHSGSIAVDAATAVTFNANSGTILGGYRAYAQLGHGGYAAVGDHSGSVNVQAGTSIAFTGGRVLNAIDDGEDDERYAQLGHGGTGAAGDHSGAIAVLAGTTLTFTAGSGAARSYVQIGHGGHDADSVLGHSGNISVVARTSNLAFTAGAGASTESYAQIGHGGFDAAGAHNGDIVVRAAGNLLFDAGQGAGGVRSYAQIGHGGMQAEDSADPASNLSGSITVSSHFAGSADDLGFEIPESVSSSTTGLRFRSGVTGTTDQYAQLGHGGRGTAGSHSGVIDVTSGRNLAFSGGGGTRAYGQLGHGGHGATADAAGGHSGSIRVATVGMPDDDSASANLTFTGSSGLESYAHLGHGGFGAAGSHSGLIEVSSHQNLSFTASTSSAANAGQYVQLGHGGNGAEGAHSGSISATAGAGGASGGISFLSGSAQTDRYAQLGHGGRLARGDHGAVDADDIALDTITVTALGDIVFTARGGTRNYVQLGNGGHAASLLPDEDLGIQPRGAAANIVVRSELGSVLFSGSTGNAGYAQLGNGGYTTLGNHRGNVLVEAARDITFTGSQSLTSTTANAYVQLGHGGRGAAGDHSGNITVRSGLGGESGDINFLAGRATDRYAQLGHGGRTGSGNHSGDIEVESWGGINFLGGDFRFYAISSPDAAAAAVAGDGSTGRLNSNSTTGRLSLIQAGTLVLNLSDPTDADLYAVIVDDGFGNLLDMQGNIVGSVNYANSEVGFDLQVANAGSTLTPNVFEFNYSQSYAQLGHGGRSAASNIGNSGDIRVVAGLGGVEGDIVFSAGVGTENYAQLGHGGASSTGDHVGDLWVDALGDIRFSGNQGMQTYAHLGHGGHTAALNTTSDNHPLEIDSRAVGNRGDIFVNTRTDLVLNTGGIFANTGGIFFTAGSGRRSYVQIGHGGWQTRGAHGGNIAGENVIDVRSAGDIVFVSGDGSGYGTDTAGQFFNGRQSFAQLGHGGYDSDAHNVNADAEDGHGHHARILVTAGGDLRFIASDLAGVPVANDNYRNYVQLGHGGYAANGDHRGDIEVGAGGEIEFRGGGFAVETGTNLTQSLYAQLGHGGHSSPGYGPADSAGLSGAITVSAVGDISFTAGNAARAYAQLGHGGYASSRSHSGNISVTTAEGDLRFAGTGGSIAYALLGHGGYQANGGHSGSIEARALTGSIEFSGGTAGTSFAQLGHGGRESMGNHSGIILAEALGGGISFSGGLGASEVYAQLGHGGRTARGDHSGAITVRALGDIAFTGGSGGQNYAQLGHGGYDADNPNPGYYPDNDPDNPDRGPAAEERIGNTGHIVVETLDGSIVFATGTGNNTFVQLGHGGSFTDGDHSGNITVTADADGSNAAGGGGNITFLADTTGTAHYAQLGHGGYRASGGHTGNILVDASAAITFTGGTTSNYVQIGHGGRNDHRVTRSGSSPNFTQANDNDRYYPGTHAGWITVKADGDLAFTAGTGTGAFGQIGHGGFRNAAEAGEGHSGAISVTSGGLLSFTAQNGAQAYVQIGHGGYEAFGNHGYASVRAEGGLDAASQGGSAFLANASLAPGSVRVTVDPEGLGGGTASFVDDGLGNLVDLDDALGLGAGAVVGSIDYASGEVAFSANVNAAGDAVAVAYLHGRSDILVDAGAGIVFAGGTGANSYAQIGHGGHDSAFSATRNIRPEENSPASYTSTTTYHLNTPSTNPIGTSGNVTVFAGTGATLDGGAGIAFATGSGNDSYAQIGNGGRLARGDHRGDIEVSAGGDIAFASFAGGAATQTQTSGTLNNVLLNGSGTFTISQTANLVRDGSFTITYANPLTGFSGTIVGDGFGRLFDGETQVGTISTGGVIAITVPVSSETPAASVTYDHFNTGLRTYVQIGHGGHDADFPNATTPGDPGNLGNILVSSQNGAIDFSAGSRTQSYAQIGHGGYATNGDHSGNVTVEALGAGGAIAFSAGTRPSASNAYAQIGHGGSVARGDFGLRDVDGDGVADGDIAVRSSGSITFASGSATQAYTQIGHGGFDSDTTTDPDIPGSQGNILVQSLLGDISFSALGSVGGSAYTQIGHGGMATNGDFSGSITVQAFEGAVAFAAGSANDRYAQLGHGGRQARGASSGDIEVLGATGVSFSGGGFNTVSGAGSAALNDAAAAGGGATGTLSATANLERGSLVITVADPLLPEYAIIVSDADGILTDLEGNPVGTLSTAGVVAFDVAVSNPGPSGIAVTFNHVNYSRGYAQLGHGGHDANPTGSAPGTPGQSGAILVASTGGDVAFSAGQGEQSYTLLGHGGHATPGDHSGNIVVRAAGDVRFDAGRTVETATGTLISRVSNFAQLGHGGMTAAGHHSGGITVSAGTDGSFGDAGSAPLLFAGNPEGSVAFTAGTATDTYVQLGHGGRQARGDHGLVDGEGNAAETIAVTAAGDIAFTAGTGSRTYAQLGHGGHDANMTAADPRGMAANLEVRSLSGSVLFNGGSGNSAYAQLGNGGYTTTGSHRGNILVEAAGNVNVLAPNVSASANGYAQLGHGGRAAIGNHSGSIVVRAGLGGEEGGVFFRAGTSQSDRYAQLGHGGRNARGTHSGNITVNSLDTILFQGGTSTRNYAQLGHGGQDAALLFEVDEDTTRPSGPGDAGNSGEITVASSGGNIEFRWSGTTTSPGTDAYVQLGHGGSGTGGDHSGSIAVSASNNLLFRSSSSSGTGQRAYAQLGHGGFNASGNHSGHIEATAEGGTVQFLAGGSSGTALVDEVNMAGAYRYVQLGHGGAFSGGAHSGDIAVQSQGNISFANNGTNPSIGVYRQLGHGGYEAASATGHSGEITVASNAGSVIFTPGVGLESYAQLGHGGLRAGGSHSGAIRVLSGNAVTFNANSGTILNGYRAYAQLGHGGYGALGDHSGDIAVRAGTSIAFTGGRVLNAIDDGEDDERYARIGHGGTGAAGDHSGDIAVLAGTTLTFTGGANAARSYVQIGHGGHDADSVLGHRGNISVAARTSNLAFTAGAGESRESFAQIGHGGFDAAGAHRGDITVRAAGNLLFDAGQGAGSRSYAQLGHGGMRAEGSTDPEANLSGRIVASSHFEGVFDDLGDFDGDGIADLIEIPVSASSSATGFRFRGGVAGSEDHYAQIGHGGRANEGSHSGDIELVSGRVLTLTANAGTHAYVQVGHGGHSAAAGPDGGHSGDIRIETTGIPARANLTAVSGTGMWSYLQIGHGGFEATGNHSGDLFASVNQNATFTATASTLGNSGQYVQFGHGGVGARGSHSGDISLIAGTGGSGVIDFIAGNAVASTADAQGRSAQLGHGGYGTGGGHSGDIQALAHGNIRVRAGRLDGAYAQVGHGGLVGFGGPDGTGGGNSGDIRLGSLAGNVEFRWSTDSTGTSDTPGVGTYAQLGHGGYHSTGDNEGDIVLLAGGNVDLRVTRGNSPASIIGNYTQVGHGGYAVEGNQSGNITVSAGTDRIVDDLFDIDGDGIVDELQFAASGNGQFQMLSGAGGADRYVQVGHGGAFARGDHGRIDADGNAVETISVTALGDVIITSRGGTRGYAQIGNGGVAAFVPFAPRGAAAHIVVVSTGGTVRALSSTGTSAYAQIGNGGRDNLGDHRGNITVEAGQHVTFTGSQSNTSTGSTGYVQLGHGGLGSLGDQSGDIAVRAGLGGDEGDVVFTGGKGTDRYAQLGHGGRNASGDKSGDITVTALGDVRVLGGDFRNANGVNSGEVAAAAALGGGESGRLRLSSSTFGSVVQPGSIVIVFTDPEDPENTVTIVDNGAGSLVDADNNIVGAINYANATATFNVAVAGDGWTAASFFNEANFSRSYAQIGHGGSQASGSHVGNVGVSAGGEVAVTAGVGIDAAAHIGHGGRGTTGDLRGDVSVAGLGGVTLQSGIANDAYTQIGHGGHASTGNFGGTVQIVSGGDLSINGGSVLRSHSMVGHGGIVNAGTLTAGTREGDVLIRVQGTVSAVDNASRAFLTHRGLGGVVGDSRLALVAGQIDTSATDFRLGSIIGNMINAGSVEIGVTGGDLHIDGPAVFANSAHHLDLFASGSLTVPVSLQNAGAGGVHLVAGWDGATGLVEDISALSFLPIDALSLEIAQVLADADSWGNSGASAQIGSATGSVGVSAGSANGDTTVLGDSLQLLGSNTSANSWAQIGYRPAGAGGASGNIHVGSRSGGLTVQAGASLGSYAQIGHGGAGSAAASLGGGITLASSALIDLRLLGGGANAYAQIGHGGLNYNGSLSGDLAVSPMSSLSLLGGGVNAYAHLGHGGGGSNGSKSGGISLVAAEVLLRGGTSLASYAQIGHGGNNAQGTLFDGDLMVVSLGDLDIVGGNGGSAYAQIGHGGASADAAMAGNVTVAAGGNLALAAPMLANAAFAKIGHGDDFRGPLAMLSGTGTRSGDVTASAGGGISLSGAMIGHVNSVSLANAIGGVTQVGASRNDPTDPLGGDLFADAASRFHGEDELRFYLPRRSNNLIEAGAMLNGESYGGAPDAWLGQQDDEYAVALRSVGGALSFLGEHGNAFGTGPSPATAAGFAFYYDLIALGAAPPAPPAPGTVPGGPAAPGSPLLDFRSLFPNDRAYNDWLREMEALFEGFRFFGIYYEGFESYESDGRSRYQRPQEGEGGADAATPPLLSLSPVDESPLRRQLQILAEVSDSEDEEEEEEEMEIDEEATQMDLIAGEEE